MHAQFLHQLAFAGDAIQIADQQDTQEQFGVNRRTARLAVAVLKLFTNEGKTDVLIDEPQQMRLRNLVFQAEVVEQSFGTGVLSHHD